MNRETAVRLIQKLDALADPTRGGTTAERYQAARKAASLRSRFGVRECEARQAPERPRTFTGRRRGPTWFDVRTGASSDNVRVYRHNSPGDWHIEIEIDFAQQSQSKWDRLMAARDRRMGR